MKNFCEYYANLPPQKKCLTLLFCPCVTLYYLIYNLIVEFGNLLTWILEKCIFPVVDHISRCLSVFADKFCCCVDYILNGIVRFISRVLEFILRLLGKFCSLFKPIFTCISRVLNYLFQNICNCLQKIYAVIENLCILLSLLLDRCFEYIYEVCLAPICKCLKNAIFSCWNALNTYFCLPVYTVAERICGFVFDLFKWLYRIFIKPIIDYLLRPIFLCFKRYIFYYLSEIFTFLWNMVKGIFIKLAGIIVEVKNTIVNLFYLIVFRGRKTRMINPQPKVVKKRKNNEESDATFDLEMAKPTNPENGGHLLYPSPADDFERTSDQIFRFKQDHSLQKFMK